ncbi:MAG: carbamate kinase [Candidatus Heimdallarchaeota archaeon]
MAKSRICIALGGNAVITRGQKGTIEEQRENITNTAEQIVPLTNDHEILITHGNGPQIGNLMLQQEAGSQPPVNIPIMPFDVSGAMTQGQIGYLIQNILGNLLLKQNLSTQVVTIVTQVIVSADDFAFQSPSKPVGPFYQREQIDSIRLQHPNWDFIEDAGRGFRRIVPSPDPIRVHEEESISKLLDAGFIVVAAGGGGIPIIKAEMGFEGIEAVIDKDLASERLASAINAKTLAILTDTDRIYRHFGTRDAEGIDNIRLTDLIDQIKQRQFGTKLKGSMGPKLEAARRFLVSGGRKVIISRPELMTAALRGEAGTTIVP